MSQDRYWTQGKCNITQYKYPNKTSACENVSGCKDHLRTDGWVFVRFHENELVDIISTTIIITKKPLFLYGLPANNMSDRQTNYQTCLCHFAKLIHPVFPPIRIIS